MSVLRTLALKHRSQIFLKLSHQRAYFINVICAFCQEKVLVYKKAGSGRIEQCYLDQIAYPRSLRILYPSRFLKEPEDLGELRCPGCNARVGFAIKSRTRRLAYRLCKGMTFKRRCDGL